MAGECGRRPEEVHDQVELDIYNNPGLCAVAMAFEENQNGSLDSVFEALDSKSKLFFSQDVHSKFLHFLKKYDQDSLEGYFILDDQFKSFLTNISKENIMGNLSIKILKNTSSYVAHDLWFSGSYAVRRAKAAFLKWEKKRF